MQIFTQNAKMKRSSQNGIHLYNFGIPAFQSETGLLTCPNAVNCVSGCYARMGAYIWPKVKQAYEARLALTQSDTFQTEISNALNKLLKRHKTGLILIRIHDSGDFYSLDYFKKWNDIALAYQSETRIKFYAYTKMVRLVKSQDRTSNFEIIFSMGGKQDEMIQIETDRHSKVFQSETELISQGYIDASHDDTLALGPNNKIGLVYHGNKNFNNTNWKKVA